jgi:putative ABC transport system permease protein
MSFPSKVTVRNIFRYKLRIIMTMIGIASCSMILTASFLIRDSITSVLDIQYNDIFTYDSLIYLDGSKLSYELDEIFTTPNIENVGYIDIERIVVNNTNTNLVIPNSDDELEGLIKLRNKSGKLKLSDDGVIVTSKLAKIYKLKVNDTIKLKTTGNMRYEVKVTGITDNYISNYIYMSKNEYQSKIGLHKINAAYIKLDSKDSEEEVINNLLEKNKNILSILSIKNTVASVQNMFTSLDRVVLIVVIFSFLLTVVVLYSLAHIVISEREREIATLKVLGFDNQETDMYLLREQTIIVCTSILIGLIIGIFYSLMLVDAIEINMLQFNKNLTFRSFIVVLLLMLSFSIIVGQMIHFRLKRIKLVESLKSIE